MKNQISLSVILGIIIKGNISQEDAVVDLISQTTCSDKTSVQDVNQKCMDMYNISITIPSAGDLAVSSPQEAVTLITNFILDYNDVICSETDNYTKAVSCLFYVSKECNNMTESSIYPTESDFLQDLNKTCEVISYITSEDNHAVDIANKSNCSQGVDETVLSGAIQQCMDQNNVPVQLSDATGLTKAADADVLHSELKDKMRTHTENICSNLDLFLKASNCIYYMLYRCRVNATFLTSMLPQTQIQTDYNLTCSVIERLTNVETQVTALGDNLDCTDLSKVADAQQQCFSIYNLSITMANPESIAGQNEASLLTIGNLVFEHTAVICQNTDGYKMAVLCLFHILFQCGSSSTNILSTDSFRRMDNSPVIDNICTILTETHVKCLRSKYEALGHCDEEENAASADSCRLQDKVRACEYPILRTCGDMTVTTYENMVKSSRQICRNRPDSSLVLTNGHVHRMDCSTVKGRKDGYMDCLLYNGIFLDFPTSESHVEVIDYIMRTFSVERFTELCSNIPTYQAAIHCTLAVYQECRSEFELNLLPDYSTVESGIDSLCQNKEKFDNTCVMNSVQIECRRNTSVSTEEERCSSTASYSQCMMGAVVQSCNEKTRAVYKDLLTSLLPGMCVTSSTPTVTEQTRTTQLGPKGHSVKKLSSVMILLICVMVHL